MKIIKTINLSCGQTYLMETHDGHLLECGDVFMSKEEAKGTRPYHFRDFKNPSDINKRVMTICTLAGCPMHCRFCASNKTFKRKLTAEELNMQVNLMIKEGIKHGRNPDPNNASEFRILYTRMGEPLLNTTNVIASIHTFIKRYPHVNIGMSTSGIKKGVEELLKHPDILPYLDMQFSLHSTDDRERTSLFDLVVGKNIMSIPEISFYTKKFFKLCKKPICLNVILFKGFTYNFSSLLKYFDKTHIWLRLSPWNTVSHAKVKFHFTGLLKTKDVVEKKPLSNQTLKRIIKEIERVGIAYAYAPAIDEEIKHKVACGQALEAFKQ